MKKKILLAILAIATLTFSLLGLAGCGPKECFVTINLGYNTDGTVKTDSRYGLAGEEFPLIQSPTMAGYTFVGWDKEIPAQLPEGEFVLTALWELQETPESAFVFSNNTITGLTSSGRGLLGLKIPSTIGGASVKKIGRQALMNENYFDVVLPNSITEIGEWAFMSSNIYNGITLPTQLKTIGDRAFDTCNFKTINLPESLTTIGSLAFESCNDLTTVNIPKGVKTIGAGAFARCSSLTSITVSPENTSFKADDGNLYNFALTSLIHYAVGKTETTYYAPNTVNHVSKYAFYGNETLKTIQFYSLSGAESLAFYDCRALENIVLPSSSGGYETDLNGILYRVENNDTLILVYYPEAKKGPVNVLSGVKKIEEYAFYNAQDIGVVNLPATLQEIGQFAFNNIDNLTGISFNGTTSQFESVVKGSFWCESSITQVACSNGNYTVVR